MKNQEYDTKGHVISYENDNGHRITDYSQIRKNLGLNNTPSGSGGSSSNELVGGPFTAKTAVLLSVIVMGIFGLILTIISWMFFKTWIAIVITVFFVLLVAGFAYSWWNKYVW